MDKEKSLILKVSIKVFLKFDQSLSKDKISFQTNFKAVIEASWSLSKIYKKLLKLESGNMFNYS